MTMGKIFVGTSGWNYSHWKGPFYPADLKASGHFGYYQQFFNTVELNNPFYRVPPRETFQKWRKNSSRDFVFSVKANRFITHMKKLMDAGGALEQFIHNAKGLREKLGPVLYQLPPGWKVNVSRLETFAASLPGNVRAVFEFRNPTW